MTVKKRAKVALKAANAGDARKLFISSLLLCGLFQTCGNPTVTSRIGTTPALLEKKGQDASTPNLTSFDAERGTPGAYAFVPGEVLITFKTGTPALNKEQTRASIKGQLLETIHTNAMKNSRAEPIERLKISSMAVEKAIAALAHNPNIQIAEPNSLYSHSALSNDPAYLAGQMWGLYGDDQPIAIGPSGSTNQYGSHAEKAWNDGFTGSKQIYIGIIDEGYMYTHPDLAANVGVNPGEIPGDGKDNDGNGYIDDVYGWDFDANDNSVYDGSGDDHGTHVAGTIGGVGGNGAGVPGVNWQVSLLSGKFLGSAGGSTSNAIKALDYFTDLKTRHGINIVATNNSWGGGGSSTLLMDAINRSGKANILFICAAGNNSSNNDTTPYYPAAYKLPTQITVGAIDSLGTKASFSNYGTSVDIAAPGVSIYSTLPPELNNYGYYSGTSMATPHVTGSVALYASRYPAATAAQIRQAIIQSATATPSLAGFTANSSRLNVYAALQIPPSGSSIPTISIVGGKSVLEGNSGTVPLTFTINLSSPASELVSINWATASGSAASGVDFASATGSLSFAPGEITKTISVLVNGDTTYEGDESVYVSLSGAIGATIATSSAFGTILNDDAAPIANVSISDLSAKEGRSGTTRFPFVVSLSNSSTGPVTINWSTNDGTAKAGSDYVASSGSMIIPAGAVSATININVNGDRTLEPNETFTVNLTSVVGASLSKGLATGTILNDDR